MPGFARPVHLVLATLALGLAACGGDGPTSPAEPSITIRDNSFAPDSTLVALGTTLRWVNQGAAVHDATQYQGEFASGAIAPGGDFRHTFNTAGIYHYACGRHPGMQGTVVVK